VNSYIYIFGDFANNYTQYPDDYARQICQIFHKKATAESQIIVHRDNNLMYYGYIRKLSADSQYIGFCVLLNGVMFTQIGRLFPVFENAVTDLVARGEIIAFNEKGDIVSKAVDLKDNREEIVRITSIMRNDVSGLEDCTKQLPPVSYGISKDCINYFSIGDNNDDIVDAACKSGYTYIFKDKDCDTELMSGYKSIIKKLHKEKTDILGDYNALRISYDKLNKQKKQYKKVVILCLLTVFCGIGLFFLKNSLESTKNNLVKAQEDITQKAGTIDELNEKVENLQFSLQIEQNKRKEAENKRYHVEILLDSARNNLAEAEQYIMQKTEIIESLNEKIGNLQVSMYSEQSKRKKAENELAELKRSYGTASSEMPIIITDVQIANVHKNGSFETEYGGIISSRCSMFLRPRIRYKGIGTGRNITLNIKLYTPSGLSRGASSPANYTQQQSFYVHSGTNYQELTAWGGSSMGYWAKGTYRYEFWYNNACIKTYSFTIY